MTAPWPLLPLGTVMDQVRWIVFELEGGKFGHRVVNNPKDPGKHTLSGLTRLTYSRDYLRLPAPALTPLEQFAALTLDDVVAVIVELFAMRTGIWRIQDPALRFCVLDFAINAGADDAIPALQRALGVTPDGSIGRDTMGALEHHTNPRLLFAAVLDARYQKAGHRIVERPDQLGFLHVWLDRFGRILRIGAAAALLTLCGVSLAAAQISDDAFHRVPIERMHLTRWSHVCTVGTITLRKREADGDWHVKLQDGGPAFVVAEAIPELPAIGDPPAKGTRVEVCGISRIDRGHRVRLYPLGWPELHPVTRPWRVVLPTTGTAGVAPVALDILPHVALAPASVRILVTVERDASNRLLGVNLDGPNFGRYFEEQLDGVEAARTRQRIYDGLPGGEYLITACVRRVAGRPVCARPETLDVIGWE